MRQEFRRIAGALVHGILATHLDVAAEWNGADAVVGVPFAEAEQPLAEPNGEDFDSYTQPLGHSIVAQLMDQDHEAEDDDDRDQRDQKVRHKLDTHCALR